MKVGKKLCILCCFAIISALLAGCIGQEQKKPLTISEPEKYFPLSGIWSYKISPGTTDPLFYQVTETSISRSSARFQSGDNYLKFRTIFFTIYGDGTKGTISEITQDDLGIFKNTNHIDWIIYDGPRAYQGSPYPEGTSSRVVFFLPPNGEKGLITDASVGEEDVLTYIGPDNTVPGCQETCMHFVREVKKGSGTYGYVDKGFIENQWFAKNKGLVLLKQEVEGTPSMTWTLEKFIPV